VHELIIYLQIAITICFNFISIDKIPARLNVALMLFLASFCSYMLRVNFSIIIIKMSADTNVNATALQHSALVSNNSHLSAFNESADIYKQPHLNDDHYAWNKKDQGLLLSAYFYGYIFPNLLGGSLSDLYGGRKVIFITMFLSALITALSSLAADDNFIYMFIMRLALGIMGGFLYPAEHQLISKWSPVEEKGKFVSTLLGGIFGTLITWPVTGFLAEHYGWRFGFYVPAVFAFFISIVWLYFVHDAPKVHPRISEKEKELIAKSLGTTGNKKKTWPPMRQVLTSLPFYALLLLHFGGTFGLFFLLTAAPKFMSEVLKFKLTEAGILSSLPYLARLLFGFIFGSIGDTLKHKNVLSTTAIRKLFCVFCE
jgi:ACS family sodium-dependent inorganic phosphate cotransporter